MESDLKPVMVLREAERVNVKGLVETERGLAVDADARFTYIGDVTIEKMEKDGLTIKRWFAWTIMGTSLGPWPNRVKAVAALLSYNRMRAADIRETMNPLF